MELFVYAINNSGEITGQYWDSNLIVHGFVRSAQGVIPTFDAPGADGTYPYAINGSGEIAGNTFIGGQGVLGMLRSAAGQFTSFTVPGGGTGNGQGTEVFGLSASGHAPAIGSTRRMCATDS
jgi:hypothetical protein